MYMYAVYFHITERLTEAWGLRMPVSFDSVTDGRYSPAKPMINYMQMSIGDAKNTRCAKKSPITFRKSLFSICIILSLESTSWFTSPSSLYSDLKDLFSHMPVCLLPYDHYSSIIPSLFHSELKIYLLHKPVTVDFSIHQNIPGYYFSDLFCLSVFMPLPAISHRRHYVFRLHLHASARDNNRTKSL